MFLKKKCFEPIDGYTPALYVHIILTVLTDDKILVTWPHFQEYRLLCIISFEPVSFFSKHEFCIWTSVSGDIGLNFKVIGAL